MSLERRTPMRRMSKKRRRALPERARVREEVLERDEGCVARWLRPPPELAEAEGWPWRCGGRLDVDEIVGRGRGGDWLDPENCQALCRTHHDWKHAHPAAAELLGLSASL